jgi:hypothetical protein
MSTPSCTESIQRLADSELSDTERTALLRKIDDETPERWRDVALCLLGTRLVAEGLRSNAAAPLAAAAPTNVVAFPLWKKLGALAAALVVGVGIGSLVLPPRTAPRGDALTFASLADFKKAVSEAVNGDWLASSGGGAMLGDPGALAGAPGTANALDAGPDAGTPPVRGTLNESQNDAAARAAIAAKVNEIQQHLADLQRLLQPAPQ